MTQTDDILVRLRDEILSLALPPGEKLSERWLESRFSLSRTPVRAALLRLEGEGLIRRDGRLWAVAPIDIEEIAALSEYREALEAAAIGLAVGRASPSDWDALAAFVDTTAITPDRAALHRMGSEFHTMLARLCANPFIARGVEDVMTRLARARWIEVWIEPDPAQAAARIGAEHRAIVEALRAGDAASARSLAIGHVRAMRDRLLRVLTEGGDGPGLRVRGIAVVGLPPGAPPGATPAAASGAGP